MSSASVIAYQTSGHFPPISQHRIAVINVNTNMYNFACVRMYKITRFLALNEPLIDKNHLQWLRQLRDVKYDLKSHSLV